MPFTYIIVAYNIFADSLANIDQGHSDILRVLSLISGIFSLRYSRIEVSTCISKQMDLTLSMPGKNSVCILKYLQIFPENRL